MGIDVRRPGVRFTRFMLGMIGVCVIATGARAQVGVRVYCDRDTGAVTHYMGFLHGFVAGEHLPGPLVRSVSPTAWRIGEFDHYRQARRFTSNISLVLSDGWIYRYRTGQIPSANPSADWDLWEAYVADRVNTSIRLRMPIAWWDVWNEADHGAFWDLDGVWGYGVFLETYRRTVDIIAAIDPDARILGPSFANFNGYYTVDPNGASSIHRGVTDVVEDLDRVWDVRLDGVSWHQNDGLPATIPFNADEVRQLTATFDPPYDPPLIVNEYNNPVLHFMPIALAAYVHELDRAGIAFANLACWDVLKDCGGTPDRFSTCWAGLDGTLLDDYATPLAPYWFWRWHAGEAGVRLTVETDQTPTFAMASRDDEARVIRMFVARGYGDGSRDDVSVQLSAFPYPARFVRVERAFLPDKNQYCQRWNGPVAVPCPEGPELLMPRLTPVVNGVVTIPLEQAEDMGVYFITVTPVKSRPDGIFVWPSP